VKTHALLPVVNIARWAALGVGSTELQTTKRLRAAAGSEMLPDEHADRLIEVFDVLQTLRLRYQLTQISQGGDATDILERDRLSPIDRSVVAQAVREIAATQRRMDRVAVYVDPRSWAIPRPNSADSPRKPSPSASP
jgi:CBS domain-containing protein